MSSVLFRGSQKRAGVLLIAGSIEDWGSFFIDPKGTRIKGKTSGLGPAKKIECPTCLNPGLKKPVKGLLVDRFGREEPCPMCTPSGKKRGSGRVWADRTNDGEQVVQSVDTSAVPTKAPKMRTCLDCEGAGALPNGKRCRTCRGEGRITVDAFVMADAGSGGELDPLDAYTAAIERRDASGSYREYLLLEAELRARSPHVLRPFRALYVEVPRARSLPDSEMSAAERAVRFLTDWMPDPVRVPGWVVRADEAARAQAGKAHGKGAGKARLAERDARIVEQFRARVPVKEIAASAGLSVARVNEIVYQEREIA